MNTVLFVNATIGFSVNLFLLCKSDVWSTWETYFHFFTPVKVLRTLKSRIRTFNSYKRVMLSLKYLFCYENHTWVLSRFILPISEILQQLPLSFALQYPFSVL